MESEISCDITEVKIVRKSAIFRNKDVARYYKYIFDQCDSDKDGAISISELREFLAQNEELCPSDKVVKCVHNCFDKNQNQSLDFEEFLELINHPTVTQTFTRIGSKYLKFVAPSSVRRRSLTLKRTDTNTGLYEEQINFNWSTVALVLLCLIQVVCFYADKRCNGVIKRYTKFFPEKRYEIWRYVTYTLNHGDAPHLYGNMFWEVILGIPLVMVHSWRVLIIYFGGALGGCLMHYAKTKTRGLIGASPGVYSFYSAHLACVILNWNEMSHPFVNFIVFGIMIVCDAVFNFVMYPNPKEISYVSHIGGCIVGLFLGFVVLRNLRVTKIEIMLWYTSLFVLSFMILGFAIENIRMNEN